MIHYYYYCDPHPQRRLVRTAGGYWSARVWAALPLALIPVLVTPPGVAWWSALAEGVHYYYYYCDPRPPKGSVCGQREATGQHGATAPPLTLVPRPSHPPGVAWWLAYAEGVLEHSNNKGRKKDVSGGSVESVHVVGAVSKHESEASMLWGGGSRDGGL